VGFLRLFSLFLGKVLKRKREKREREKKKGGKEVYPKKPKNTEENWVFELQIPGNHKLNFLRLFLKNTEVNFWAMRRKCLGIKELTHFG
jgi:hypothetical protein